MMIPNSDNTRNRSVRSNMTFGRSNTGTSQQASLYPGQSQTFDPENPLPQFGQQGAPLNFGS